LGDSPQALFVNLSEAEAESFFADRAEHGFNTLWINLLCATYTGGRADGSTLDGIQPFTAKIGGNYDLTTPNPDYFARIDRMIAAAGAHGLMILLDPCETGSWLGIMSANGPEKCRQFGRFLGSRYAGVDNLLWMSGNDFQDWRNTANDEVVLAVANGIRETDSRHLHTLELDYFVSSSLDDSRWGPLLGLNATYTYYPTYAQLLKDYNRTNFLPNFMVEANYEFEHDFTGQATLRRQEYWSMLSGAAGQLYGNRYTWPFESGWQANFDTEGVTQLGYLRRLFLSRRWFELVPDQDHTLVTGGYGTFKSGGSVNDSDYVTAAMTPDHTIAMAYLPTLRPITVDTSKIGTFPMAYWFDPTVGTFRWIPPPPSVQLGPFVFTPPGPNHAGDPDWVLLLETNPSDVQGPAVSVTSPAGGQSLVGTVLLTAEATDADGVSTVRFLADGVEIGSELAGPLYTFSWDSTQVGNGTHFIVARATDNALNTAISDPVTVTVNNTLPPPPTDGLNAAYPFDETAGNIALDTSTYNNHATLHGTGIGAGENAGGLVFNGTNSYAEAPNSPTLDIGGTRLTIAFWANVESHAGGSDYVVVGKPWQAHAMTYPFYQYGVEFSNAGNKTFDFYFGDPEGSVHGPFRISAPTGVWTHVAFTYNGTVVKGYRNGVEVLSVPESAPIQARGQTLRLGVDGAYAQFYRGILDDLWIYDRALGAKDIQAVMRNPVLSVVNHPPKIATVTVKGANLRVTFSSVPAQLYRLQYTLDLVAPNWQPVGSVITGAGGLQGVSDSTGLTNSERFYRIIAVDRP
jgi:hypothetical protein